MRVIPKRKYYENYVYILAYNIPQKYVKEKRPPILKGIKEIYSQAIGKDYFTLLEVVSDPNLPMSKGELVMLSKFGGSKIKRVSARLFYDELVEEAKIEVENILKKIIKEDEKRFVEFFNSAGPLSIRVHSFEVLPRIGKKTVEKILFERSKKPFESYDDIKKRIGIQNLEEIIYERLITEITSKEKLNYYIFAKGIQSVFEERERV